jgi:hypothetical protein
VCYFRAARMGEIVGGLYACPEFCRSLGGWGGSFESREKCWECYQELSVRVESWRDREQLSVENFNIGNARKFSSGA